MMAKREGLTGFSLFLARKGNFASGGREEWTRKSKGP